MGIMGHISPITPMSPILAVDEATTVVLLTLRVRFGLTRSVRSTIGYDPGGLSASAVSLSLGGGGRREMVMPAMGRSAVLSLAAA